MPRHRRRVDSILMATIELLISDSNLPEHNRDHALSGNWAKYRECHIKPDLYIISGLIHELGKINADSKISAFAGYDPL